MAHLPEPGSPWAVRYGVDSEVVFSLIKKDALLHSGLAPSRPWLDPRFYDTEPGEDEFAPPATYQDLDETLITEESQRDLLKGIPSWKAAPLNSVLSFWDESPTVLGGHRPNDANIYPELLEAYMSQRIEVEPKSWLPFFKKNHWYDFSLEDGLDTIEEADGTKWTISKWSVDNDRVWHHVRFSIEIANRIVMALIRDNNTWLGTLLYGRVQRWYELYGHPENAAEHKKKGEDKRILLTPSIERSECVRMNKPFLGQDIEPDAEKRREFICHMLEYHSWGFIPSSMAARGDTTRISRVETTFARINVTLLKHLCGGTISIAERCVLYVRQAMTVNELMHCLYMRRICTYHTNVSPELRGDITSEPFMNSEPIAELGRSFEAAIFGGTPWDAPVLNSKYGKKLAIAELGIQYPSRLGGSLGMGIDRDHPAMKHFAPVTGWYLPAAFFWRLQSKKFWDPNPPDGRDGFLFPRIFYTERTLDPHIPQVRFKDISIDSEASKNNYFQEVIRRWNERLLLWSSRRPWYDLALNVWEKTPWSYILLRVDAERFITAYKQQNEAECADAAEGLENSIPLANCTNLPAEICSGVLPNNSSDGEPSAWLFYCLGMLMMAALPQRLMKKDQVESLRNTYYEPSIFAKLTGYSNLAIRRKDILSPAILRRDSYFERLADTEWCPANSRMDFLNQATAMIAYLMHRQQVSASMPFFKALLDLLQYIKNILEDPSFDQSDWLPDFPFQIPDYDPNLFMYWDSAARSWMNDRRTPTVNSELSVTESLS
ncbi:hypothetical protein F5Y12DRAFT_788450 [Xylaria sp. FL1777]|nr:hypothetical protein F5Y12DRAFT_788450 [Xylaria sp. FL1777]